MCIAPDTWHDACTTCYSTRILDILDQRTKVPNTEYYILRFRSIWHSYLSAAERYVDLILTPGLDIIPLLVYFYRACRRIHREPVEKKEKNNKKTVFYCELIFLFQGRSLQLHRSFARFADNYQYYFGKILECWYIRLKKMNWDYVIIL